jgi:hydroxylamine dehydrogenase
MCHREEVEQYQRGQHADPLTIINRIDKWLIHGMNNLSERTSGCFACHGTTVVFEGQPEACGQCHLGPDHTQIEIYTESKHGTIYHAEKSEAEPGALSQIRQIEYKSN